VNITNQLLKYLKYRRSAKTRFSVHSPFVFNFIVDVLRDKRRFYAFDEIDCLRDKLLDDTTKIEVSDFGAGSKKLKPNQHSVKKIVKNSAVSKKFGELFFKMIGFYKPKTILEIGTSTGISTLYLSLSDPSATIITLEGCPNLSKLADDNFERLKTSNITQFEGHFDQTLPMALEKLPQVDLVFFDGNHRKEATLAYFNLCLKKSHRDSIFIFDDIHWSPEMEEAWNTIIEHPDIKISIDLFRMGMVFFRSEHREEEHYKIKF
jgi:predicted O-methyltransferase YrrM